MGLEPTTFGFPVQFIPLGGILTYMCESMHALAPPILLEAVHVLLCTYVQVYISQETVYWQRQYCTVCTGQTLY